MKPPIPSKWKEQLDAGTSIGKRYAAALSEAASHPVSSTVLDGRALKRPAVVEPVGTVLKRRIQSLVKIRTKEGCGCNNLAAEMDRGGIQWCEANREYIVDHLVRNRDMLIDAISQAGSPVQSIVGWMMHTWVGDNVLQKGANWLLDSAIAEVNAQRQLKRPQQSTGSGLRVGRIAQTRSPFQSGPTKPRFISSAQLQADIKTLLSKLPADITAIAGVARSGLCVATMLSMYLHLPMFTIRQSMGDVIPTGNGWRLGVNRHIEPAREKVLVVDDTVMTGNSLRSIKKTAQQEFQQSIFAAVYVNPHATMKPDVWAVDLPWPHLLEWNLFNSVISPSIAMDFDGILCRDCRPEEDDDDQSYLNFLSTAEPVFLPRKVTVPLIITARLEKYRQQTEAWLQRHSICWSKLVMHPAATLAERRRDDIVAYKAIHYSEWASRHRALPGPAIFIESDDYQARAIAARSGRLVVCPASGQVY